MTFDEVLKITVAILASVGGASAIVLAMSNWLGKVWANRILETERAKHNRKLEEMRAVLSKENQSILEQDRAEYNKKLEKLRAQLVKENQSLAEAERSKYNHDLEELKANLAIATAELSAENKARRDYEYEARKRLYQECEPFLFRLSEASENAIHRIFSIARTARKGDLGPKKSNWFQWPGYYMASTIYNLLVPLVIFRLLQNKLTLVDLTLDRRISNQYIIAKWLNVSFTEDFVIATNTRKLEYEPFVKDWKEKRDTMPEKYWRQGVTIGRLDVAIEGMIKQMPDGNDRCMSFGEFETAFYNDLENNKGLDFGHFADIFSHFHPARRPILWRILVLQAHLYSKIMELFVEHGATGFITNVPSDFFNADIPKLDWRQNFGDYDKEVILEPVTVAKDYLHTRVPDIFH